MTNSSMLTAAALFAALATTALAQQHAPGSHAMPSMEPARGMATSTGVAEASPSTKAFKAADEKMMGEMDRPMTGNADQDFVAGMLPHHSGAVAMARVELQYGNDLEMLKLARGIIAAQAKEIAQMQAWQKRHLKP